MNELNAMCIRMSNKESSNNSVIECEGLRTTSSKTHVQTTTIIHSLSNNNRKQISERRRSETGREI